MRLSRFYIDQPLAGGRIQLPEASAHYISRKRMQAGDALQLFDGSGQEFPGVIVEAGKNGNRRAENALPGQPDSPPAGSSGPGTVLW